MRNLLMNVLGSVSMSNAMYIHVPFCDSICAYCDFERCKRHPLLTSKWLNVIIKEIQNRKDEPIQTLYIGGGTPTSLTYDELNQLLSACDIFDPVEYTIEANIENLTKDKIMLLRQHGVNRISLGVQSLDQSLIKLIERHHSVAEIFSKIDEIYECGIVNISVDMIYGLPTQSLDVWLADLKQIALNEKISHVSIYSLTIEENSAFGRRKIEKVSDELDEQMYFEGIRVLEAYGFEQYEISNFARQGKYSCHNCAYWEYEDFIGIGVGAYGKENHIYYHWPFQLNDYIKGELEKEETKLTKEDEMFETIMMGLRMKKGVSIEKFNDYFHEDLREVFHDPIEKHIKNNHLEIIDQHLRCTSNGWGILNSILIDFME